MDENNDPTTPRSPMSMQEAQEIMAEILNDPKTCADCMASAQNPVAVKEAQKIVAKHLAAGGSSLPLPNDTLDDTPDDIPITIEEARAHLSSSLKDEDLRKGFLDEKDEAFVRDVAWWDKTHSMEETKEDNLPHFASKKYPPREALFSPLPSELDY